MAELTRTQAGMIVSTLNNVDSERFATGSPYASNPYQQIGIDAKGQLYVDIDAGYRQDVVKSSLGLPENTGVHVSRGSKTTRMVFDLPESQIGEAITNLTEFSEAHVPVRPEGIKERLNGMPNTKNGVVDVGKNADGNLYFKVTDGTQPGNVLKSMGLSSATETVSVGNNHYTVPQLPEGVSTNEFLRDLSRERPLGVTKLMSHKGLVVGTVGAVLTGLATTAASASEGKPIDTALGDGALATAKAGIEMAPGVRSIEAVGEGRHLEAFISGLEDAGNTVGAVGVASVVAAPEGAIVAAATNIGSEVVRTGARIMGADVDPGAVETLGRNAAAQIAEAGDKQAKRLTTEYSVGEWRQMLVSGKGKEYDAFVQNANKEFTAKTEAIAADGGYLPPSLRNRDEYVAARVDGEIRSTMGVADVTPSGHARPEGDPMGKALTASLTGGIVRETGAQNSAAEADNSCKVPTNVASIKQQEAARSL